MPSFAGSSLLALLPFCATLAAHGSVIPLLEDRAPHFAQILQPTPDYLLFANSTDANATLLFTYRNGERAQETTATVSLQNDTGIYPIASDLLFVDNWYTVNETLSFSTSTFADGNYSLVASEYYQGQMLGETSQPIILSHDVNGTFASGNSTSVPSTTELASTSSSAEPTAYWGAPSVAAQAVDAPVAVATPNGSQQGGSGAIEGSLKSLLAGFVARRA